MSKQSCVHNLHQPWLKVVMTHHRECSDCLFRCRCDTSVSLYRWCTMRRTQTCPRSPRWLTAREVHRCYSGVFRNIQCIRCRCWHSRRWATAPWATPYCSELKKMVGSLTLIPGLPFLSLLNTLCLLTSVAFFPLNSAPQSSPLHSTDIYLQYQRVSVQQACTSLKCSHYKAFSSRSCLCDQ